MMSVTMADVRELTWQATVERFVEDAEWLTSSDLPQLKALYAIAKQLDQSAASKMQAALVSQFTLTQRTLVSKGAKIAPAEAGDTPLPGLEYLDE